MLFEKLPSYIFNFDEMCQEYSHLSRLPITIILDRLSFLGSLYEELANIEKSYTFKSRTDEIDYYKIKKPELLKYGIFYERILDIEGSKPFGDKNYYKDMMESLRIDSIKITYELAYYRRKDSHKDNEWFIKESNKKDIFAVIMAFEMLEKYLDNADGRPIEEKIADYPRLKWTRTFAEYGEMVNAFHEISAFNKGEVTLEDINKNLSKMWDISISDIHSTTHEIFKRKEPGKFSLMLVECLRKKQKRLFEKLFNRRQ